MVVRDFNIVRASILIFIRNVYSKFKTSLLPSDLCSLPKRIHHASFKILSITLFYHKLQLFQLFSSLCFLSHKTRAKYMKGVSSKLVAM